PAALPDDFDEKQNDDPVSQLEQLMQAGRLYWIETHADGSYTLGVYVGHSLPDRLRGCEPFDIRPVCSKPMGGAASDVAAGERAGGCYLAGTCQGGPVVAGPFPLARRRSAALLGPFTPRSATARAGTSPGARCARSRTTAPPPSPSAARAPAGAADPGCAPAR